MVGLSNDTILSFFRVILLIFKNDLTKKVHLRTYFSPQMGWNTKKNHKKAIKTHINIFKSLQTHTYFETGFH